ncbi:hypothetical protein CLV92_107187 [Kineococcus xinjiangensis]|uniref:Uncharacterized protein n=1 Tax=Kineococcus xinjiangensis TaxID=512762 RepID=A0A2S6IKC6_9ACTN|nr:hypothetical protein [Kineococcus xinjiangensis]PPK94684.1 hypothetical protein CLV92_107187 [Kineococcus xinjiangensis]
MTSPDDATPDQPNLDDVMQPTESTPRDRQEHGKMPARPRDDQLEQLVEHEREMIHGEDPDATEIPPATD